MDRFRTFLERLKIHVINNPVQYPTNLDIDIIKGITLHTDKDLFDILGLSAKEDSIVEKNEGVKLFDIMINYEFLRANFTGNHFELVMMSLITHEFIHSISKGYCLNHDPQLDEEHARWKDEAYTDFYAKKLFRDVCSEDKYYCTNSTCMVKCYMCEYFNILDIDTVRNNYFRGS